MRTFENIILSYHRHEVYQTCNHETYQTCKRETYQTCKHEVYQICESNCLLLLSYVFRQLFEAHNFLDRLWQQLFERRVLSLGNFGT